MTDTKHGAEPGEMTHSLKQAILREKLNSLFESVFSQGVRAGKDVATETYEDFDAWNKKGELDEAMQLITSLIKELVAEAKLEEYKDYYEMGYNEAVIEFEQNLLKALEEL